MRYTGDDTGAWEAALCRRIPAGKKRNDWRNSFRALSWMRMGTSAREVEQTALLLGRTPTSYRDWVRSQVEAGHGNGPDHGHRVGTTTAADAPRY